MSPVINLPMLVLAAVRVAEVDGKPMTARDVAFLLAVPQEQVDLALYHLVKMGSITQDGDLYRNDVTRHLTAIERAGMLELEHQVAELSLMLDNVPVRLHS